MTRKRINIKALWKDVRTTTGFRKFLTFLVFVGIATLFWWILALNDNIQDDFEVKVNVFNVPDSVTFISDIPKGIHVMVKDKGTNLWRNGVFVNPSIDLNFREFAQDGVMLVNYGELTACIKRTFGQNATIISSSADSLKFFYTTLPGKRVPVEVVSDLSPAVGKVISGQLKIEPSAVIVYSTREVLDTITRVYTEKLHKTKLEEPITLSAKIKRIAGVKTDPAEVKVTVNVEPLVRKQVAVNIQVDNVPAGEDLLLFPSTANVEYYLPMSMFGRNEDMIEVRVDYRDLESGSKRLPLHLGRYSKGLENVRILEPSVEYTLVKN